MRGSHFPGTLLVAVRLLDASNSLVKVEGCCAQPIIEGRAELPSRVMSNHHLKSRLLCAPGTLSTSKRPPITFVAPS